ncbi:MAG: hypothetical protein ACXW4B_05570 [Micavibrio sp.]
MGLALVPMYFLIKLVLTFIFAPIVGCIFANIPGAFILAPFFKEASFWGTYILLLSASLIFAYIVMLVAIFLIGFFSWKKYHLPLYLIFGALMGLLPVAPLLSEAPFPETRNIIPLYGMLIGASIAAVSYFIMNIDQQKKDKPPLDFPA